ncbi:hypothetical protein HYH03_015919 [Edaphochlamys debaryana]|uniref:CCR4-NOT transcription complex subunit 3 n=1 Tax=Edaphochlamys debaryana TaxID=47281 RepID=A0A836BQS4_9CHLO|nr:hypothetical protein HYH03_015919 [Edaphochlamys debaryana]|eukprot:KAG2485337.1 hypothetical protein HYH03_015919 [Edaphochlamys debaryana]
MERFKACEKEAKAKGSAAGGADRDPKQRAKDEARDWINTVVDQLTEKVETMEAEMEELQVTVKKRQKPPARLTALEETVTRHKDHIERLEKVLRCIDNETIGPEELSDLKEDMDCYLGTEDGEDGGMDLSNVEDMYGVFQDRLDAVDNAAPAAPLHSVKHTKGAREKEADEAREKERERERAAAAAAKAQLIAQGNTNLKLHDDEEEKRKPPGGPVTGAAAAGGAKAAAGAGAAPATAAAAVPGLPMAVPPLAAPAPSGGAAGARQTAPTTPAKEPDSGTVTPRNAPMSATASMVAPSPGLGLPPGDAASPLPPRPGPPGIPPPAGTAPPPPPALGPGAGPRTPAAPPGAAAAAGAAANGGSGSIDGGMPRWLAAAAAGSGPAAAAPGPASGAMTDGAAAGQEAGSAPDLAPAATANAGPGPAAAGPGPGAAGYGGAAGGSMDGSGRQQGGAGPGDRGPAGTGPSAVDALASRVGSMGLGGPGSGPGGAQGPGAVSPQAQAGPGGAQGGPLMAGELPPVVPAYSVAAAKQVLESCYARGVMPQLSDTEWRHTRPRHPVAVPASYPKTPPEVVDNPALFRKMDPECLFFAFYFQPNTYQQFLAAHELKRQSWRFHRHHNAWFQRFTEPSITSEEYEQGTYVYFDYNIVHDDMQTGWCYRRKENFTFRYDALEDELRVANLTPQQTVAMAMAQVAGLAGQGLLNAAGSAASSSGGPQGPGQL